MGKSFEKELEVLGSIYEKALGSDCTIISDFIKKYQNDYFLLIGSGGSYSVAAAVELFCVKAGLKGKCLTPLELAQYETQIKDCAVMLFTASGKNADSKNTYQYLSELEPKGLLTVCMHTDSPISRLQVENSHNFFFEYKMPVEKDGYLAVESLVSSIIIMSNAFFEATKNDFFQVNKKTYQKCIHSQDLNNLQKAETIIVLNGGMISPALVDLESKFGEAALGNIQILDYRNFAHGRHLWLSKRKDTTAIVAFIDNENSKLAEKTLGLLPEEIPIFKIYIKKENVDALLEAYDYIFDIVNEIGKIQGVDPGRPKVEEFGRKLYHISHKLGNSKWLKTVKGDPIKRGVYRKLGAFSKEYDFYYTNGFLAYENLRNKIYKGIILDYDGTLHIKSLSGNVEPELYMKINEYLGNGIKIGIATGRGKSVRNELQKVIAPENWQDVVIAYYNGGCIGLLSDDEIPNKRGKDIPKEFFQIQETLKCKEGESLYLDGTKERNPYQLSIISDDAINYMKIVHEKLAKIDDIKILTSSHSLDIIPKDSCKNNILQHFEMLGYKEEDFIRIGDSGYLGGNDYELLNCENGISVDLVSCSPGACWNFAPLGKRNLEATIYFFEHIEILENGQGFRWLGA